MEPTPSHPPTAEHRASTAASVWRPLRGRTFRDLLIADIFSDVGTFMQSVGAAWLMVSLQAGPMYVALTQTASALPFFLFALPAGALGDICDRRKLILFTEIWMALVAIALAALVITGFISPWLLLALTFALSAGDAFETPTWRAVLPELVAIVGPSGSGKTSLLQLMGTLDQPTSGHVRITGLDPAAMADDDVA